MFEQPQPQPDDEPFAGSVSHLINNQNKNIQSQYEKRASVSKAFEEQNEIEDMPIEHNSAPLPPITEEINEVKKSQEQVFDYMDVIKEQSKKMEQKLLEDDDISELERKKKEADDQKVQAFEKQLSKKREEEVALEKQKIVQKKAEEKERLTIKELEAAKAKEEKELEKARTELEAAKARQQASKSGKAVI